MWKADNGCFGNGCVLQTDPQATLLFPTSPTSAAGTWTLDLQVPNDVSLLGAVLTAQVFVYVDGGPLLGVGELSNGLEMRIGF